MKHPLELNREEVTIVKMENGTLTLSDRNTEQYVYTPGLIPKAGEKERVRLEAAGPDWFVFRSDSEGVHLLLIEKDLLDLRLSDESGRGGWVGTKIYGYCNGYFDRDHYGVYEHVIEAEGEDWIVARDNDEYEGVYLAHFMDTSDKDKHVTYWSSEGQKREWDIAPWKRRWNKYKPFLYGAVSATFLMIMVYRMGYIFGYSFSILVMLPIGGLYLSAKSFQLKNVMWKIFSVLLVLLHFVAFLWGVFLTLIFMGF